MKPPCNERNVRLVAEQYLQEAKEEIAYLKRRVAEREEPIAKLTKMSHDDRQEIAGLKAMVAQARAALSPVESAPDKTPLGHKFIPCPACREAGVPDDANHCQLCGKLKAPHSASPLATESKPSNVCKCPVASGAIICTRCGMWVVQAPSPDTRAAQEK